MKAFLQELQLAVASLRRSLSFVTAVVVTLGLTLGTLLATAVLAYVLLLKPLPYPDHERLHVVQGILKNRDVTVMANVASYASAGHLHARTQEFEQAALLAFELLQYSSHPRQPLLSSSFVSPEYFALLDTPLALGRPLGAGESPGSYKPFAVISYRTWQEYFQGRPDVLGQSIELSGRSYGIVGVTAKNFDEPKFFSGEFAGSDVWLPWDFHRGDERARVDWGALSPTTTVIAKLAPGRSAQQVVGVVSDALNRAFRENVAPPGQELPYSMSVQLARFEEVIAGDSRSTALLLLAGALTLLFIACSNIMNLMLSRTVHKQKQLTIQAILGANRTQLFLHIFAENIVLMCGVVLLSIIVGYGGFAVLRDLAADYLPRLGELAMSAPFIVLACIMALLLALLFAAVSIRIVKYDRLQSSIQASGKGAGLQISAGTRAFLIAAQVALIGILICANVSVLQGAAQVIFRPMGFSTEDLVYLSLNHQGAQLTAAERDQMTQELVASLQTHPQIAAASSTTADPTRPANGGPVIRQVDDRNPTNVMMFFTGPRYFEVMQQSLQEGRDFTDAEVREKAQVGIVTRALADKLYPNESALGKTVIQSMSTQPYTIVGIAGSLSLPPAITAVLGNEEMNRQHLYMPGHSVVGVEELRFLVKLRPAQRLDKRQWSALIHKVSPNLSIWLLEDMEQRRLDLVTPELTAAKITIAITVISMFLAGIGIYGVLNYNTALRRHELGIRMSLGADPLAVARLVFLSNAKPILWGLCASVVLGVLSYSVARQYLAAHMNVELVPIVGTAILILLVAAIASYLPLRTTLKRWPVYALRDQ